jgi:hypothetical protein
MNIESPVFSYIPNRLIIKLATLFLTLLITIWAINKVKWLAFLIALTFTILTIEPDFSINNIIKKKQKHAYYKLLESQKKSNAIFNYKVKGERRYKFQFLAGKPADDGELIDYKNYDLKGNLQQSNNTRFYYDSLNRKNKEIIKVSSDVYETVHYITNSDSLYLGYLKVAPAYTEESTIKYDSLKNKIYSSTKQNGLIQNETEYLYDNDTRLIKFISTSYNPNNSTISEYKYTDTTKIELHYNIYGQLISEIYFRKDSAGNWIEQRIRNDKGIHLTTFYFYNEQGQKIKEISKDSSGFMFNEFLWEYDKYGNLLTSIDYEGVGGKKKAKYFYDSKYKLKEKKVYDIESDELLWSEIIVYEYYNN